MKLDGRSVSHRNWSVICLPTKPLEVFKKPSCQFQNIRENQVKRTFSNPFMTWVSFSIKQQARRVILSHNASKPLFLYLPFQSVHGPLSVDLKYEQKYRGIRNKRRRTYAGMVDILDEAIGNVTEAMKEAGWVVNGTSSLKETFHILRQSRLQGQGFTARAGTIVAGKLDSHRHSITKCTERNFVIAENKKLKYSFRAIARDPVLERPGTVWC